MLDMAMGWIAIQGNQSPPVPFTVFLITPPLPTQCQAPPAIVDTIARHGAPNDRLQARQCIHFIRYPV